MRDTWKSLTPKQKSEVRFHLTVIAIVVLCLVSMTAYAATIHITGDHHGHEHRDQHPWY